MWQQYMLPKIHTMKFLSSHLFFFSKLVQRNSGYFAQWHGRGHAIWSSTETTVGSKEAEWTVYWLVELSPMYARTCLYNILSSVNWCSFFEAWYPMPSCANHPVQFVCSALPTKCKPSCQEECCTHVFARTLQLCFMWVSVQWTVFWPASFLDQHTVQEFGM